MNYCKFCTEPISNGALCPKCVGIAKQNVPAHRLLPGTILNNRYLIGKTLGEGGFGITYVGRDLKLNLKVAVKEYYPNGLVNRNHVTSSIVNCSVSTDKKEFFLKGRDKFLLEARTLALFSKEKSIVEVRDFFEANNTAYIIMEYLEGQDLREYLKANGVLPYDKAIQTLMPVMRALAKIHKQSLIHRDISPDNIRLTPEGVKLIDFGAAREMTTQINQSISVMLKPGYAPEEQYRSKGVQGPWTDVYAVCATLYKCITGTTPDDATQRVYADELKMPSQLGFKIPPAVEKVIIKGMSVLQQNRYQSMDELMSALTKALATPVSKPSTPKNPNKMIDDSPLVPEKKKPATQPVSSTKISGRTEKTNYNSYNGNKSTSNSSVVNNSVQNRVSSSSSVNNTKFNNIRQQNPTTLQHIPPQTNYTTSASTSDEEKKNYTPFIIIGIAALIAIIVGVIIVFSSNSTKDIKTTTTTTTTTQNSQLTEAQRLNDAEQLAKHILDKESHFDVKALAESDVLGWDTVENAFDNYFMSDSYYNSVEEAYADVSTIVGVEVTNAEEFLKAMTSDPEFTTYEQAFGTDFKIEYTETTSSFISKDEAGGYIQLTKSAIDYYNHAGFNSDDIDWSSFKEYAKVELDTIYSGSEAEFSIKYTMILGYINNEWKLIYAEDDCEGVDCLFSLTMVGSFFEE